MADFQALQAKYAPVVDTVKQFEPYGAKFVGSELVGEQYHLVAQVPSQVVENRVWDAIKSVDPQYADLKHEITNTGGPNQTYKLQSGDNLSKVSKLFYGDPNHYTKIAEASGIDNPDHVRVGQDIPCQCCRKNSFVFGRVSRLAREALFSCRCNRLERNAL